MDFYTNVHQYGNSLCVRGVNKGVRVQHKIPYRPYLFIATDQTSSKVTLDGKFVERVDFDSIKDARAFIERYKEVPNFKIYGTQNFASQWITDNFPNDIVWDGSKIRVTALDIEVACPNGFPDVERAVDPILAITIRDSFTGKFHTWGMKDFKPHLPEIEYRQFDNEAEMMLDFLDVWSDMKPDVITGWNCRFFDVPYVINRISTLFGEDGQRKANLLSPWYRISTREISLNKQVKTTYEIAGVSIIDYLEIYKKYTYTQKESYKLSDIAQEELGQTKVEFEGSLEELYRDNFQLYIEYNIQDVNLIDLFEKKMQLIRLVMDMTYMVKTGDYTDTYGTVKPWEVLVFNYLWKQGIVVDAPKRDGRKTEQYEGAYVKDPVPGRYPWIVNYDFDSLYPNVVRQVNIGPDTRIPYAQLPAELVGPESAIMRASLEDLVAGKVDLSIVRDLGLSMSANKQFYTKSKKSFFSSIFEGLYNGRVQVKDEMKEKKKQLEAVKAELERRSKAA